MEALRWVGDILTTLTVLGMFRQSMFYLRHVDENFRGVPGRLRLMATIVAINTVVTIGFLTATRYFFGAPRWLAWIGL